MSVPVGPGVLTRTRVGQTSRQTVTGETTPVSVGSRDLPHFV